MSWQRGLIGPVSISINAYRLSRALGTSLNPFRNASIGVSCFLFLKCAPNVTHLGHIWAQRKSRLFCILVVFLAFASAGASLEKPNDTLTKNMGFLCQGVTQELYILNTV